MDFANCTSELLFGAHFVISFHGKSVKLFERISPVSLTPSAAICLVVASASFVNLRFFERVLEILASTFPTAEYAVFSFFLNSAAVVMSVKVILQVSVSHFIASLTLFE